MWVLRWALLQNNGRYSQPHSDSTKMDALTNGLLFTSSQWQCCYGRSYKWTTIQCFTMTVWRWMLLQIENYSLHHSDSAKMDALTNEALFTASQSLCGEGRSYKWQTIHCLTVTVWRWTLLEIDHYSLIGFDNVEYGRSYKWYTIHCITGTVRRSTLLKMKHYSLPHNDSVEMDALTNRKLFTASQWKYDDGRSYKWSTIHYLTITVWRWTLLQIENYSLPHSESTKMDILTNGPLFAPSEWQCWDERSYKWNTIHSLTVNVREMDALTNGPLFTSSQWQFGDGRSCKWTSIQCFISDRAEMDALTNWPLITVSHWQCEDGIN